MKQISKTISVVLHPVVISIVGVYMIVMASTGSSDTAFYWTILSGVFAAILGAFVVFGVLKGFFNNFDVSNRKQRVFLYPFAILVVLLFGLFVYLTDGPSILITSSIIFMFALFIFDLLNNKVKASVHVASVASIATGITYLYGLYYLPIFLLVVLSALARLVTKRHTVQEVTVGGFLGIALTLGAIFIVRFILST